MWIVSYDKTTNRWVSRLQGSSSASVEATPFVTMCITRVPAGNSKSQMVFPSVAIPIRSFFSLLASAYKLGHPALQINSRFKVILQVLEEFLTSPMCLSVLTMFQWIKSQHWYAASADEALQPAPSKMFKTRSFAFATRPALLAPAANPTQQTTGTDIPPGSVKSRDSSHNRKPVSPPRALVKAACGRTQQWHSSVPRVMTLRIQLGPGIDCNFLGFLGELVAQGKTWKDLMFSHLFTSFCTTQRPHRPWCLRLGSRWAPETPRLQKPWLFRPN